MGLMDHIRKSMDPNFVAPEEIKEGGAKQKIAVTTPMSLDERIKASIAEAVDPKTKKKQAPVAPDLEPPVQKPDPNAGKPPPVQSVADPETCKKEKAFGKGVDQEKITLGGKTPVDLNPSTEPPSPKDLEDPAMKKEKKKVNETFKDAMKLAGKGTLRIAGRMAASGVGLPPKKTVGSVEKFVSAWKKKPGTAVATVASTRRKPGGGAGRKKLGGGARAKPGGPRKPGGGGTKPAASTATVATAKRGRTSLSGATSATSPAKRAGTATSPAKRAGTSVATKPVAKQRASSVLGKTKSVAGKAPAAKDMSIKKTSTSLSGSTAKRERSSLSSGNDPIRMDRKDFAKQMKASGNNLKKVRTSLSDEFIMEWKGNRFNQPAPLSSHTADEHFEKMIDHHDAGLDAKERGDKSGARVHFNTRDHHFSHFVAKATDHDLKKRKLNMHKVRAMLDIKEEADPLDKVMSIYRRLHAV